MQKSLRIAIAAGVAVAGLGASLALSQPAHQVAVGVLSRPAKAGVAIPASAVTTITLPASVALKSHFLTKAQLVGFVPASPISPGVPVVASERLNLTVPSQFVALPLSVPVTNAENVVPGSRVAIYTVQNGQQGGTLDATGVKVLNVMAPVNSGSLSSNTGETILIEAPTVAAAALVGSTLVLANMGGHPATQWYVTGLIAGDGNATPAATSTSAVSGSKPSSKR
ncbi:SAF domain-containing protein [Sulfobacillus sp. hq2]|uniref:SAF domain-containing protein n=1 Tax=Sulfobacillus TaxID=28033 RepID=UPI000CD23560|nr:SAF domain-containing protein [Sulfobacillus sp. hq2]POB12330.1 hypothetical protein CO251_00235 [Sulfobacillus sp. hq2]